MIKNELLKFSLWLIFYQVSQIESIETNLCTYDSFRNIRYKEISRIIKLYLEDVFMKAIKIGTKVEIYNDMVMTYDELPAKAYLIKFTKMSGFFLDEYFDIEVSEDKIYGGYMKKVEKSFCIRITPLTEIWV